MTTKEKATHFKEGKALASSADVISVNGVDVLWYYNRRLIARREKGALKLYSSANVNEMKRYEAILEAFEVNARIVPAFLTENGELIVGCLEAKIQ